MRIMSVKLDAELIPILEKIADPEIPVLSILDLGIVLRAEKISNTEVEIDITPTYTGCPAMDMIKDTIKATFLDEGFDVVTVKLLLTPAWSSDWMSTEGKLKLKKYGIAPPVESTNDKSFLMNGDKIVPCPLCQSNNTELISLFGSTACKSLYKCLDCKEPFDYFKCH